MDLSLPFKKSQISEESYEILRNKCLDLLKVIFYYTMELTIKPPFGEYVSTFSRHLKQIQYLDQWMIKLFPH